MKETEYTDKTCIVVMDLNLDGDIVHVGTLVDQVVAVLEIEEKQIEAPPGIGATYQSEFISGVARIEDHFIMILDMINIFSTGEITSLREKTNKAKEKEVSKEVEEVN